MRLAKFLDAIADAEDNNSMELMEEISREIDKCHESSQGTMKYLLLSLKYHLLGINGNTLPPREDKE